MPTVLEKPITNSRPGLTTTVPLSRPRPIEPGKGQTPHPSLEQHSLPRSIVLHLLPGAALFGFVLVAAALGMPAILALLVGIALVIVPLELGYLLYQGKRRSGRWSVWEVIDYRDPLPARRIALWTVPLVAWFIVMLFLSVAVFDERIADGLFSWIPSRSRVRVRRGRQHVRTLGPVRRLRGRVRNQRHPRTGGRGALLPRPSAAPDRPLRPRGARAECRALLPLPLLDAVAEHRPDPRAAPLDLHGLAKAQPGVVDGRPHFGELHLPSPSARSCYR